MEQVTGNFTTSTHCQAFYITADLLEDSLAKAREEGRDYAWAPLDSDYWLPEKADFDYEIACPNFLVVESHYMKGVVLEVDVQGIFVIDQKIFVFNFAKVFQVKGEPNVRELVDISRMYAYLRFCSRDDYRDMDRHWWSKFFSENVVSNETVIIFREDKQAAQDWAQRTFPRNSLNAWIGKCGEFVFATWAAELGMSVSTVDLKPHPEGDEFDFSHNTLFLTKSGKPELSLDVKTFQLEADKKRDWWNVGVNCLQGKHKQDLIIFVVIDEDFRMGKVVGYLEPDTILKKGKYIENEYSRGYYRVYLKDILNPYYLRAMIDSKSQVFEGIFFGGVTPSKGIENMIKDYSLDPITAYYAESDYNEFQRGGLTNLMAKPTLKMFVKKFW